MFENALSVMIANWIAVRCRKGVSLNSQSISSCRGGSSSSAYKPTVFYKHLLAFLRTNFGTVHSVYSCTFCHLPGAVKPFFGKFSECYYKQNISFNTMTSRSKCLSLFSGDSDFLPSTSSCTIQAAEASTKCHVPSSSTVKVYRSLFIGMKNTQCHSLRM